MKTWLTIIAVLALAAAAYEWPTSKTVPTFSSWLGPVGESGIKYGPGGAATTQYENKGPFTTDTSGSLAVTITGGGGGGSSQRNIVTYDPNVTVTDNNGGTTYYNTDGIISGVNSKGTRFTYSPDGGMIYVQK